MRQPKQPKGKKLFIGMIFLAVIAGFIALGVYGVNKMSPGIFGKILPDYIKPEINIEKTEITREIQLSTSPFWKTLAAAFFAIILVLIILIFLSRKGKVTRRDKPLRECIKVAQQNAMLSPHLQLQKLIYWQPAFENGEHKRYGFFFSTRPLKRNEPLSCLKWSEIKVTDVSASDPVNDSTGFREMTVNEWERWKKSIRSGELGEQLTPTKAIRPTLFGQPEVDYDTINEQTNVEIGRQIGQRVARGQPQ